MSPDRIPNLTRRCGLRTGHGGTHLWVSTADPRPLPGECPARPPVSVAALNATGRAWLAAHPEHAVDRDLSALHRNLDGLVADVDRLAIQIDRLLRERARITDTLRQFYRSTLSLSSAQAVINLALELAPDLAQSEQLPLPESE
jgi:hypothetical protein